MSGSLSEPTARPSPLQPGDCAIARTKAAYPVWNTWWPTPLARSARADDLGARAASSPGRVEAAARRLVSQVRARLRCPDSCGEWKARSGASQSLSPPGPRTGRPADTRGASGDGPAVRQSGSQCLRRAYRSQALPRLIVPEADSTKAEVGGPTRAEAMAVSRSGYLVALLHRLVLPGQTISAPAPPLHQTE